MTRLSGEFQTDLALPDALTACVDAIDGLGWNVQSVEANQVQAVADPDPVAIEVELHDVDGGTEIRLIGADSEDEPVEQGVVITALEQARDAIGEKIEQAEGGREPQEQQRGLPPAGWFPDPEGSERQRYWDGEEWTGHYHPPMEPAAAADQAGREASWWQRNRRSVVVGVIALLIGGGIGAAAASGGDSSEVRTKVNTRTVQGPVTTVEKTVTDTRTVETTTTVPEAGASGAAPPSGGSTAGCHPDYEPCLDPNSFDYDCEGGRGDGPDYTGTVTVVGDDPYDLDSDGNGVGCE